MTAPSFGQNELLARNYFDRGEYEKALTIYDKLYRKNPGRLDFFLYIIQSNQQLENFSVAEELLLKKLNTRRIIPQLYVELGYNYSLQDKDSLSHVNYRKAIEFAYQNPVYSYTVGKNFEEYSLLNEAVEVYESAMAQDPNKDYNVQLARIYGELGKMEEMFGTYLNLMRENPAYRSIAKRNFSQYVNEDPNNEANVILRKTLLKKSQANPNVLYNELLSWLFIQQKQFKKAFAQEKAIYRRDPGDLTGIVDLGLIAIDEKAFEEASEIVDFIIENAPTAQGEMQGQQYRMTIMLETASPKDYPDIEKEFESLLDRYGRNGRSYALQLDYNHFLAFSAGKKDKAISNLKLLANEELSIYQQARVKMELADVLVFDEKFNQALIFYSQIQKKVKNDILAQEASFKVAKTSYYKGDFEWAQVQLDVLKKSASQLISNDAMELSLMIRDNSLEDSTQTALKKFARADLLELQKKYPQAIATLNEILENHKGEKIEDEALLRQGRLYEKTNQFEKAEAAYLKIIEFYKEDILADDAFYHLAKLYENQLGMPEKAKDLYEQIIYDFADSIYFVEARKRFRMLRGDIVN
jgi:tetratricopeptide (TPR) repeat protein